MRRSLGLLATLAFAVAPLAGAAAEPEMAGQRGPGVEEAGMVVQEAGAPLGLIQNPIGYVVPGGRDSLGIGLYQKIVEVPGREVPFSISAAHGIRNNLQVGAFYARISRDTFDHRGGDNFFGATGQWMFLHERRAMPAISLGAGGYFGAQDGATIYLAASKNLFSTAARPGPLFLHAGVRWDTFGGSRSDSDFAPFVGANLLLSRDLSINAEVRTSHSWESSAPWAIGAAYAIGSGVQVAAGFQDVGSSTTRFYIGLGVIR